MSGKPDNRNKEQFTRAAFLCAALVLVLALLHPLFSVIFRSMWPDPTPTTPPPSSDPPSATVIVLFGSASDPLYTRFAQSFDRLCADNGWRLISYDCRGKATNQKGQIEDFIRKETADIAVLFSVMEQEEQDAQIKELRKKCKIITVGQKAGLVAGRYVAAHISADETERIRIAADYFRDDLKQNEGILQLSDVPDDAAEALYEKVFSQENVTVLGKNYTWTGVVYAERYLNVAFDYYEGIGGIFCTSHFGTEGSLNILRERGLRDQVKIVCLNYEPSMADSIALGGMDAAVAIDYGKGVEILQDTLQKAIKGEEIGDKTLPLLLITAANVDDLD